MEIELVQIADHGGDTVYNLERVLAAIADHATDTELVVFPEIHLIGFPSEDNIAALAKPLGNPMVNAVRRVIRRRNVSVAIGIAEADADHYYDTTLLIAPDGITLKYRKIHLQASDRGIFTPGDHYATALWNGIRVGLLVRFDIEFPGSTRALSQLGVELITVTDGNVNPYGPTHRTVIMARAMGNQVYAVVINHVGHGDGGLVFAGGSVVVDPYGQLLCEAGCEECRQIVGLDPGRLQDARRDYRYLEGCCLILPNERHEHPGGLYELLIP